jgi:hypothetical protein
MGVKTETNGTRYDGQWALDEFQGIGIYVDARGMTYQGEWESGTRHGYGVEWIYEEASDGSHDHRAGRWERDEFLNDTPRQCCDVPNPELTSLVARTDAKKKAFEVGRRARAMARIVAENRASALQAARRGQDERKRTMLTTDVKRLREMGAAMKRRAGGGGSTSKQEVSDPYTTYLEAELESALRKQKAAERRLRQTQRMATLAEQQWTEATSYNAAMANERNEARAERDTALKWQSTAEDRWENIAEMRDMLLQLRVALHVSKKEERRMDRKTRDALKKAERLQLKLNKTLTTVQRTAVGKLGRALSRQNNNEPKFGTSRSTPNLNRSMYTSGGPALGGYGGVMGAGADAQRRMLASRGALTSAGSSIIGLTPPGSPEYYQGGGRGGDGRPITPGMGLAFLPEVAPQGTPLYYSPVRDQHGRAVSPVHPSRRVPSRGPLSRGERRAQSPNANAKFAALELDAQWKWPQPKRQSRAGGGSSGYSVGGGGGVGSGGGPLGGVLTGVENGGAPQRSGGRSHRSSEKSSSRRKRKNKKNKRRGSGHGGVDRQGGGGGGNVVVTFE